MGGADTKALNDLMREIFEPSIGAWLGIPRRYQMELPGVQCKWGRDDEDGALWVSACGLCWQMSNDEPPHQNGMVYCPRCGGIIIERK